jgi:energy-coupling factor transporter ATP-binding protein EcfA2
MVDSLQRVIEWASHLPPWQSDAVRRILTKDALSREDEDEIFLMLKESHGLKDPQRSATEPQPASGVSFPEEARTQATFVLKAIEDIHNVNALPSEARLPIGHKGLTVVYGENAAGKSGYVRVLKRACRAKDTEERIYPNVFKEWKGEPARAKFKLGLAGEKDVYVEWEDGKPPPDILTNISVFDSKCARVIVDEDNQVTYLPYGTQVFEPLVRLLDVLQGRLRIERPLPVVPPECGSIPPTTEAGKFIANLSSQSNLDQIGAWTAADQVKSDALQKRVKKAELLDPRREAQRLRGVCTRILRFLEVIRDAQGRFSDQAISSLKLAQQELLRAKEAHRIATEGFGKLKDTSLPGFGESLWQALYNAAREYSVQVAYPGKEFPYVDDGAQCVLCQQLLQENAQNRLRQFRDYMEHATKHQVDAIREKIGERVRRIDAFRVEVFDEYDDLIDELRSDYPKEIQQVDSLIAIMKTRSEQVKGAITQGTWETLSPLPDAPISELQGVCEKLDGEAKRAEAASDPDTLMKMKSELAEMEGKKKLWELLPQIRTFIKQKATADVYDKCIRETDTTLITRAGRQIITDSMTPALCSALEEELKSLEGPRFTLTTRTYGQKGETKYKLALCQSTSPDVKLGDILSEGEHRIVAIAGFLAELRIANLRSPIVFDDPVSSLDHQYRGKVAERLVREAATRQVIIFTHDIAFLLELQSKAAKFGIDDFGVGGFGGVKLTALSLTQTGEFAGVLEEGPPWHVRSLKERIHRLKEDLARFEDAFQQDKGKYNERAGALYGKLREAWETCVEEVLFNKTIARHQSEVKTQSLREVLIDTNDTVSIYWAMTKCSEFMIGHSKSRSLDQNRPPPDEIRKDINSLEQFFLNLKKKHKFAKEEYERKLSPGTSAMG